MVDVDDVVAQLKLRQLLQRHGHLALTRLVAAQAVLVEAPENLMVGEEAGVEGMVGKSFVEGVVDGGEGDVVASLVEDGAQTVGLPLVIGEDVKVVAFVDVVVKRGGDEVEILME